MASFNGASFSTIYIYEQGQSLPSIANKFADLVNTAGLHLCRYTPFKSKLMVVLVITNEVKVKEESLYLQQEFLHMYRN